MKHLPVDPNDCLNDENLPRLCKLKSPFPKLPIISFTLKDDPRSPKLEIPLQSLLFKLNDNDTEQRLCIVPTDISGVNRSKAITTFPSIKFGYQVLRNFKVAVDQGNCKIGFLNRGKFIGSDEVCSAKVTCKGDQVYCAAMNTCLNPECSIWLLKSYDPNSGTCKFNMWAMVFLWITIALIGLIDIHSYLSYRRLLTHAKRLCKWLPLYIKRWNKFAIFNCNAKVTVLKIKNYNLVCAIYCVEKITTLPSKSRHLTYPFFLFHASAWLVVCASP